MVQSHVRRVHYSLFVDESGDFGYPTDGDSWPSHEWLVAGILCPMRQDDAVNEIMRVLKPVGEQYGLRTPREFHLKDLRKVRNAKDLSKEELEKAKKEKNQHANRVADDVMAALLSIVPPIRFLTVTNRSKTALSDPEQTYRMMVMDLLALAEAAVPETEQIAHLDLVVATRTTNNRLMTTKAEIGEMVLKTLETEAEVGLASRGLVDLITRDETGQKRFRVLLEPADSSWGLPPADFLANIAYNRRRQEQKSILARLHSAGRLSTFTGLGGYEARRSHVAARDGDYGGALYWWSAAEPDKNDLTAYKEHFVTLLENTLHRGGPMTARAALEGLIERCWQQVVHGASYAAIMQRLCRMEEALETAHDQHMDGQFAPLLFRLRNFLLAMANHTGDVVETDRLRTAQDVGKSTLFLSPENLALLLDLEAHSVEAAVNGLDLDGARDLGRKHAAGMEAIRSHWVERDTEATEGFTRSRLYHRARSTALRTELLAREPAIGSYVTTAPEFSDIFKELDALEALPLHPDDRRRAWNYRVMALLKAGRPKDALAQSEKALGDGQSPFDLFWAARAAGETATMNPKLIPPTAYRILERLREYNPATAVSGAHPHELLWRERGYLEWRLHGAGTTASHWYERSRDLVEAGLRPSPIRVWLLALLDLHDAAAKQTDLSFSDLSLDRESEEAHQLGQLAERLSEKTSFTLLHCARLVSPY